MNIKGVNLNKKALKALRLMQSNDSELITLYLSAIDSCEDVHIPEHTRSLSGGLLGHKIMP